ncbi:MAG: phosphomannomutase/phosphoglucomutase [Gammaproteobacteria bacterium]|nr:phosphomannomutase/phosphoglucomutase [Gammaproteobacteria bacterium]
MALGAVWFGIRSLLKVVRSDSAYLANQMAAVIAGEFEHSQNYRLIEFVDLDFNLARLGAKPKERKQAPKLDVKLQPRQTPENEMVDIETIDEEDYEAALNEQAGEAGEAAEARKDTSEPGEEIREIFRAYDIRGVVGETLTTEVIERIGLAIGTEAQDRGEKTLIVGYDGRVSSPTVSETLIEGLTASGCNVINIGMIPTPVLYFATHNSDTRSGVMVTASHNPPDFNGFKIVINGKTLDGDDIEQIFDKFTTGDFATGSGSTTEIDITQDYIDAITDDIVVAQPLKVVVDCGNGIAGNIAPDLIESLGCDVVSLYCDVDGTFPNHMPDTSDPANLADLIQMVKAEEADLGIAIDGDGDRLVAVTDGGEIVWPDRLMMLFAKDVVSRNPGSDVVYDVKCTRHLNGVISNFGGRPIICRSGHSYIKAKVAEMNAILGGEMSGHICFRERWFGFDDGLYATARLLEIVGSQSEGLGEMLAEFPKSVSTPEIHIRVKEAEKFALIDKIVKSADFGDASLTTIDGVRADFASGWGLVRASNTGASLTLRFEADDQSTLEQIQSLFREQLQIIDEKLDF